MKIFTPIRVAMGTFLEEFWKEILEFLETLPEHFPKIPEVFSKGMYLKEVIDYSKISPDVFKLL